MHLVLCFSFSGCRGKALVTLSGEDTFFVGHKGKNFKEEMELLHLKEQRSVLRLIIRLGFFSSIELLLTSAVTWWNYKPAIFWERENSGRNDIPVLAVSGSFITA